MTFGSVGVATTTFFDVSHRNSEIGQSLEFQLIMMKAIYMMILLIIIFKGYSL